MSTYENLTVTPHSKYLAEIGDDIHGYVGNNSLNWAKFVLEKSCQVDSYLDRKLDRYELLKYCCDAQNLDLNCLIAILSWGGMRRDHGRRLLEKIAVLSQLVANLRSRKYSNRRDAFQAFQQAREKGQLPGLGIGYYTKLICFLAPDLDGFIMDQWAGKSINLITSKEIVKITGAGWVTDANDHDVYEMYCTIIDELGRQMNCTGFEAEKRIFSVGRGRGQWRNYLIKTIRLLSQSERLCALLCALRGQVTADKTHIPKEGLQPNRDWVECQKADAFGVFRLTMGNRSLVRLLKKVTCDSGHLRVGQAKKRVARDSGQPGVGQA